MIDILGLSDVESRQGCKELDIVTSSQVAKFREINANLGSLQGLGPIDLGVC